MRLALEWAAAVAERSPTTALARVRVHPWRCAFEASARPKVRDADMAATLVLETTRDCDVRSLTLPILVSSSSLARVNTGLIEGDTDASTPDDADSADCLAVVDGSGRLASVSWRKTPGGPDGSLRRSLRLTPRVLSDEGAPRAHVAYATADGVVCVPLRATQSIIVDAEGAVRPHHTWPRPVTGELRTPTCEVVAWAIDRASWPDGGAGTVFYSLNGELRTEALPFPPQFGTWWNDRLYWCCYPFGVGSWAAGAPPEFELGEHGYWAAVPDSAGLVLAPRTRTAAGVPRRVLIAEGHLWRRHNHVQPVALDLLALLPVAQPRTVGPHRRIRKRTWSGSPATAGPCR